MTLPNHSKFLQCLAISLLLVGMLKAGMVVSTVPQLEKAAANADDGDIILVEAGVYRDLKLRINNPGVIVKACRMVSEVWYAITFESTM